MNESAKLSDDPGNVDDTVGEYSLYDFNHPQHRLTDPLPQFKLAGKRVATAITASLDTALHIEAHVTLESTHYRKRHELIEDLPPGSCVYTNNVTPIAEDLLMVFERDLISMLVDCFFGGKTEAPPEKSDSRQLSGTETRLANKLRLALTEVLQQLSGTACSVETEKSAMLSTEELMAATSENSVVAVQHFTVTTADRESAFSLVLPWAAIESLIPLSLEESGTAAIEKVSWCTKMKEHVASCTVDLQGKLAETNVTVSQVLDMKVGDFIPIGDLGTATFQIDNTPVFEASIGSSNGLVSASILHWNNERDSHNEPSR